MRSEPWQLKIPDVRGVTRELGYETKEEVILLRIAWQIELNLSYIFIYDNSIILDEKFMMCEPSGGW